MKLRDYLTEQKISPADFAPQVGVTPQALYRYMAGHRQPRRTVVNEIMRVTEGKVRPDDLHPQAAA